MVTRRRVLQYGLLGAGALALGGVGVSLRSSKLRQPKRPLKTLDAVEFSLVAAVAARVAPPGGKFPDPLELGVPEHVDEILSRATPWMRSDFKKLMKLMESGLTNLVLRGRPTPFTRMSPEDQDATLADWEDSSIKLRRTAYKALRGIIVAGYYANPAVYPAVGYPGPPELPAFGEPRALVANMKLEVP